MRQSIGEDLVALTAEKLVSLIGEQFPVLLAAEQLAFLTPQQVTALAVVTALPKEQWSVLRSAQREGIILGLSYEQVNNAWFDETHLVMHELGFAYEEYKELSRAQATGLALGRTRAQVFHHWYSYGHTDAMRNYGLSYVEVAGHDENEAKLMCARARGLRQGLSEEDVGQPWYTNSHADLIECGFPYISIAGLSMEQCNSVELQYYRLSLLERQALKKYQIVAMVCFNLTKAQVRAPWFTVSSLVKLKAGVSYQQLVLDNKSVVRKPLGAMHLLFSGLRVDVLTGSPKHDSQPPVTPVARTPRRRP